jgi:hypothetical protein
MTSRDFLDYLDDELGTLSKGVYLARSAAEQVETARQNQRDGIDGFDVVNPGEYSDPYGLRSCSHPELNDFRRWYNGSEKRFPPDLELTPVVTKMWYACDGHLAVEDGANPRAMFKTTNEADRSGFLCSLFDAAGFDVGFSRHAVQIPHDETVRLIEWMGEPPPGFGYNWDLSR